MIDVFPLSFIFALGLIYLDKIFSKLGFINLRPSPQTLHTKSVSRLGGLAIFMCLFFISSLSSDSSYSFLSLFLFTSAPIFLVGLIDDFNIIVKPIYRLAVLIPNAALCYFFLGTQAYSVEIALIDFFFQFKPFSLLFICIAMAGSVSACNAIDGINGLLKTWFLSSIFTLLFFSEIKLSSELYLFFTALFFAVLPVYFLNFPFGRIFLGDAGAYLLGLAITVGLIKTYQINELSPWFVLLMLSYPVIDLLVSIVRRLLNRYSALSMDGQHLHHLILRKVQKLELKSEKRNHVLTSMLIFFLYIPFMLVATNFANDTSVLQLAFFFSFALYLLVYFLLYPKKFIGR